jgi:homogentisate 1,2-dioxygenase
VPYYRQQGSVARKRHTQFRQPSGELYHEELISTAGFDGPSSLLYHLAAPTRVTSIKSLPPLDLSEWQQDTRTHHRFDTISIAKSGDFVTARTPMFFNDDVVISIATPDRRSDAIYRNGECDELVLVHHGSGEFRSQFGVIHYEANDLVHIPRGVDVEWLPEAGQERLVIIESPTDIRPPSLYLSRSGGQLLERSPYCERDFKVPELRDPVDEAESFEIVVKYRDKLTSYWLERHPFDVVGWDGCYYPFAINARDFEPIVQAIHTMPNIHQIFAAEGAAICLLVPRPADWHPLAIPAAPNHSSVDCDEVLYLIGGAPIGRKGDGPGTTTLHPRGIPHGPKPGTYEGSIGMQEHAMHALMVDTFRPLKIAQSAAATDDDTYLESWRAAGRAGEV